MLDWSWEGWNTNKSYELLPTFRPRAAGKKKTTAQGCNFVNKNVSACPSDVHCDETDDNHACRASDNRRACTRCVIGYYLDSAYCERI